MNSKEGTELSISVCMALYNGEKYVEEQLHSILVQLSRDDEIIISDDGSMDQSRIIINRIDDSRIRIVSNPKERNYTNNFENALFHAKGDYIFLADQDDVWMENKVSKILEHLNHCDFTIHDCMVTDEKLKVTEESYFKSCHVKFGFINQLIRMRYLGCCMAFNRRILEKALPFPSNRSLYEHDSWIATIAELYGKCEVIYEPLIMYRRHEWNVSSGGKLEGRKKITNLVKRRAYRCVCAFSRICK